MSEATLKVVARRAGVAPITVSRVVNRSGTVAAPTREKVLAIIRELDYRPNIHAATLSRKRLKQSSSYPLVCADECRRPCNSCMNLPHESGTVLERGPEQDRALGREIIRLRKDLDKLGKQAARIQNRMDLIQEAYSRRISSCAFD